MRSLFAIFAATLISDADRYDMMHPHIVRMRAVVETTVWVYIVMELLEGGELQDNIERAGTYSEKDCADVMLRLCSTLSFLHAQGQRYASAVTLQCLNSACSFQESHTET